MILIFFALRAIFGYMTMETHKEQQTFSSGNYSLSIVEKDSYVSDGTDKIKILTDVKSVPGGFNITFHARRDELQYKQNKQFLEIKYNKDTNHTKLNSDFLLEIKGGEIEGVSFDQINDDKKGILTVARIRVKKLGSPALTSLNQ